MHICRCCDKPAPGGARRFLSTGVGLLLLFLCGGSQLRAADVADAPIFFDWGIQIRNTNGSSGSINSIRALRSTGGSRGARSLEYMTGGQAAVADENALASAREQRPPDRLIAEHREGKVLVRHWGPAAPGTSPAVELTRRAAKALHLVTTQVWPRQTTPLQVDVYEMPDDTAYSFARKVQWKRGLPLELVIFRTASNAGIHRDVATHELYHVLAAVFRTGQWKRNAQKRPNASSAFEEVAASLFATCGALLADGHIGRPRVNSYLINGRPMNPPLSAGQLKQVLTWLRGADTRKAQVRNGLLEGTMLGGVLDSAPAFHVFEAGQERIELQSSQGRQLLDMCREFTADPAKIEPWLDGLQ